MRNCRVAFLLGFATAHFYRDVLPLFGDLILFAFNCSDDFGSVNQCHQGICDLGSPVCIAVVTGFAAGFSR